jgi:hypothetical protein
VLSAARACPSIRYLELHNEAHQAGEELARYSELSIEFMRQIDALGGGRKAVIGCFSVGMPDLRTEDPGIQWRHFAPALRYAAEHGHVLGLHQYGGGSQGMRFDPLWYALRHRQVIAWAKAAGVPMPKILITESGIDFLEKADRATRGWKTMPAGYDYAGDLRWYCERLAEDPQVLGVVDFGFANITEWGDFDLSDRPDTLYRVAALQAAIPAGPAPAPTPGGTMAPIKTISGLHYSSRMGQRPRYLVLHSAANSANATAESVARYLANNAVKASAHYMVGIGEIYSIVSEGLAAHHAGGSTLPDGTHGQLTQGSAFVDAVNACTIGVEMLQTAGQPVLPAVLDTAIPLLVDICRRNGIPAANVVSHQAISAKAPQGAHSDPVGVDMNKVRARIATALGGAPQPAPGPAPARVPSNALLAAVDKDHRTRGITLNPTAAIQRAIRADGLIPTTRELELVDGGVTYVVQRAEGLAGGGARVYWCVKGDWANVRHLAAI